MKATKPLSEMAQRFCAEHAGGLSPVDAYLAAGFVVKSREVARCAAARLLKDDRVRLRLFELCPSKTFAEQPKPNKPNKPQAPLAKVVIPPAEPIPPRDAIGEAIEEAKRRGAVVLNEFLAQVAKGAMFDARRMFNGDDTLKAITEMDDETAIAIAGFDVEEIYDGRGAERVQIGRIKKVKLVNRERYIDMGLRVLGAYQADNQQRNPANALTELLQGMRRSALPIAEEVEPDAGV